jgi:hypothetical protein
MRVTSRTLQYATILLPAVEDGQDSVKKLAFAPLGLLSLGGNASYIASILASAVSFLEGYSVEDLETDVHMVQDANGKYVAQTELKLVPYAFSRSKVALGVAQKRAHPPIPTYEFPKTAHRFSVSRVVSAPEQRTTSALELERFKDSFHDNGMTADIVANDILLSTDSVDVANAVLRCCAQVGLSIPRSTFAELVARMKAQDCFLEHTVFTAFEMEMNLGITKETCFVAPCLTTAEMLQPKRRKQSKLERLRNSS